VAIYNNVVYNTDVDFLYIAPGLLILYNKAGVIFKNNIVIDAKSKHIAIATPTIKEYDQLIFDKNIYYPDMAKALNGLGCRKF